MKTIPQIFEDVELDILQTLPEVVQSRGRGTVSFSAHVPDQLKQQLDRAFGLTLPSRLPFRWIQGDTPVHVDRGISSFENTYLVYLTNGEGQFEIGEESYPIVAGDGFVFSEGTRHGVTQTNDTARLMLGPMSEQGFAVGIGTSINADGATETVYIRQITVDAILENQYKINDGDWNTTYFPLYISNTNGTPASNVLKILFTTPLTFTDIYGYIETSSDGIQIGDTSVNSDGTKYTITIDGVVSDYPGFVRTSHSDIYVYNLKIVAINGSTLASGAGWVGQVDYGTNGTNNFIIGCSSDGEISTTGGGIVGSYAAVINGGEAADLSIIGCTTTGNILSNGGGIIGEYCGKDGGTVTISKCATIGTIGTGGGGIVAQLAGINDGTCTVQKCYSKGSILGNAGGIFGQYGGQNGGAIAQDCYSRGNIGTNGGGIFGRYAAFASGTATATNCYSSGTLTTALTGIFGSDAEVGATTSNCYVGDGDFSTTAATAAIGEEHTLNTYISPGVNVDFLLRNIGPSPYSLTTIGDEDLSLTYSQSVAAGSQSGGIVLAGTTNSIGLFGNTEATITMNGTTGVVSTTTSTPANTYTLQVIWDYDDFYSITSFTLTVTGGGSSTAGTLNLTGKGFDTDTYINIQEGQILVIERIETPNLRFKSFEDYNKYLKAQASFRKN